MGADLSVDIDPQEYELHMQILEEEDKLLDGMRCRVQERMLKVKEERTKGERMNYSLAKRRKGILEQELRVIREQLKEGAEEERQAVLKEIDVVRAENK